MTPLESELIFSKDIMLSIGIFGMFFSILIEYLKIIQNKEHKQSEEKEDISTYINEFNKKMIEAKKIQQIIDKKIKIQIETANELSLKNNKLKIEVDRLNELKNLSEKQIESLGNILTKEMDKFGKRNLKENIVISAFFFFSGIFASSIIQRIIS